MASSVPFDRIAFDETLSEVRQYLAELRYIDTALQYLEDEEAGILQKYLGGLGTPANEYIDVEFGHTYPFTKRYTVRGDWFDSPFGLFDDTRSERIRARLTGLASEASGWADGQIDTTIERVQPYMWPTGPLYESECLAPTIAMREMLEDRVATDFGRLQHSLGSWEGDAAENFASYFYSPFEDILSNQETALVALAGGIGCATTIAQLTQQSLMNVVLGAKLALLKQLRRCAAEAERERQESIEEVLLIAGGTATVVGGLAGGSLWSASLGAVAGGTQIAPLALSDDAVTLDEIRGATACDLMESLSEAITAIKTHDDDQHEALMRDLQAVLRRLEELGMRNDGRGLVPVRPNIVDGVDADSFYLP